ncbi:MAG: PAC2 family protein [Syntrophaceae bacterium]|nr:PAC2 family protein [Syntrophaceae bacterium]
MERDRLEIHRTAQLKSPFLIVSWQTHDIGGLGSRVIDFLRKNLGGEEVAEIKPVGFFPLGGVRFRNDLVQVQESKFWTCGRRNLLLFRSDEPAFNHFRFLSTVLDFAQDCMGVRELYTISGALSLTAHTQPRRILTVFNRPDLRGELQAHGLEPMTWEGPPAISSYLLWVAGRRGLPGASLWPEIPFYLAAKEDPLTIKLVLSFLSRRFELGLNLEGFDSEIDDQNEKIARLRDEDPEIHRYISRLESGQSLDEEEQIKLTREIYDILS